MEHREVKGIVANLQDNTTTINAKVSCKKTGQIHRKDWGECTLGIIAMKRLGKLNDNNLALGSGAGRELILFYLSNHLGHVYATDLYSTKEWEFCTVDFPENPSKYSTFPYNQNALTV